MQGLATHEWFKSQKKRTMLISRSLYSGFGKFGSHWLGDNYSDVKYMGYSVTGVMNSNIAGVPLVGADICGFNGNTTPELCARWYVVGAFYPFSRNHNKWDNSLQEPWQFKGIMYDSTTSYYDIILGAMRTKMNLLRYYHT